MDRYIECICKYIIKISKIANAACKHSLSITIKTIENPSTEKWLVRSIWAISTSMIAFIIFYMIPHRGFDYTDNGYAMYNIYNIAHGIVPSLGYAALINLPLYFIGLNYYLAYEVYYCFIAMLSVFLIFYAFDKHKSVMLPITIVLVLTCNVSFFLNYQLLSQYLLIGAIGSIIIANKKDSGIFAAIGIFLLCFSSFANTSLIPSILPSFFLLFLIKNKRSVFILLYVFLSFIFFYLYLKSTINMFTHPGPTFSDHSYFITQTGAFFATIFSTNFLIVAFIAALARILIHFFKKEMLLKIVSFIILSTTLFLWQKNLIINGFIWSYNNLYPAFYFRLIELQILILALVLLLKNNKNSYLILFLSLLTFIYMFGISVTTLSLPVSHLAGLGAAYISLTSILVIISLKDLKQLEYAYFIKVCVYLFFLTLATLSLFIQYNSNYRTSANKDNSTKITNGYLSGVYSTNNKINSYEEIVKFYNEHNCSDKSLVALPSLPLVYAVFDRQAYGSQAWISPDVGNEITIDKVENYIETLNHWCAIIAPEYNAAPKEYTKKIIKYLSDNSENCYIKDYIYDGSGNTPTKLLFCYK
ncbi:hypothetical protein AB9G23_03625 [Francisella philomiragia]|uniref:hypothetical protein n=1 Tax=Francisella philomiragia TaxID=28110 RepID=UPI001908E8F4|nr:hypothetical protein [Francisella philomiragia]MBK2026296.1 hypothetical protein [Francisella philomiragia]